MEFVTGLCVGIIIYSIILTIIFLYKDISSYYDSEGIDLIISGPIAWILIAFCYFIVRPIVKKLPDKSHKEKPYKMKNKKYIHKIAKKVIANAKKNKLNDRWFDLTRDLKETYYDDYYGLLGLLVEKPKYEWLNKKYSRLVFHQKEDLVNEIKQYMIPVTEEYSAANDYVKGYIRELQKKGITLYRIKD